MKIIQETWDNRERTISVEDFTTDKLLHEHDKHIRLEHQPTAVAKALGRFCDLLMDKGIMSSDEYMKVIECYDMNVEIKQGSPWGS